MIQYKYSEDLNFSGWPDEFIEEKESKTKEDLNNVLDNKIKNQEINCITCGTKNMDNIFINSINNNEINNLIIIINNFNYIIRYYNHIINILQSYIDYNLYNFTIINKLLSDINNNIIINKQYKDNFNNNVYYNNINFNIYLNNNNQNDKSFENSNFNISPGDKGNIFSSLLKKKIDWLEDLN